MKYRSGFISNSSSTSFVISMYAPPEKKKTKKEIIPILEKIIEAYNVLEGKNIKYQEILEIDIVDDKIIEEMIEFKKEYEYNEETGDYEAKVLSAHIVESIKRSKGSVILNSNDENTIPHIVQELIEIKLWVKRFHWG